MCLKYLCPLYLKDRILIDEKKSKLYDMIKIWLAYSSPFVPKLGTTSKNIFNLYLRRGLRQEAFR